MNVDSDQGAIEQTVRGLNLGHEESAADKNQCGAHVHHHSHRTRCHRCSGLLVLAARPAVCCSVLQCVVVRCSVL